MKYALVTGGSRGIGAAICKALAKEGYPVIINYVSREDAALEVKREIETSGGSAELLKFNVADLKETDARTRSPNVHVWSWHVVASVPFHWPKGVIW